MPRPKKYYYPSERRRANTEAVRRCRENKRRRELGLPTFKKPLGFSQAQIESIHRVLEEMVKIANNKPTLNSGITDGDKPFSLTWCGCSKEINEASGSANANV